MKSQATSVRTMWSVFTRILSAAHGFATPDTRSPSTKPVPISRHLLPASFLCVALCAGSGFASPIRTTPQSAAKSAGIHASQSGSRYAAYRPPGYRGRFSFAQPSSLDDWTGGTGLWSVAGNWSAGLPGNGSDVNINTGNDFVSLDASANINSLTIGGSSGTSMLQGYQDQTQTLNIARALTINQTGEFILTLGDTVTAATLTNGGELYVASGAALNLTNQPGGVTDIVQGAYLGVLGTFTAGGQNALTNLTSMEGRLSLQDHQTTNVTPIGGTLTVNSNGGLEVSGATLQVNGDLNNLGTISTGQQSGGPTALDITGTLTNNSGANTTLYVSGTATANVGTLVNNGYLNVSYGQTLNLTNQPHGITDVVAGSEFQLNGTFQAGSNSGFVNLQNLEGSLVLWNAQTTNVTPGNGTLAIATTGYLELDGISRQGTTLQVNGDVNNLGWIKGNGGGSVIVTGTLNNPGRLEAFGNGIPDLNRLEVLTGLTNTGRMTLDYDASLSTPMLLNAGSILVDNQSGIVVGPVGGTPGIGYSQLAGGTLSEFITSNNIYGQMSIDGPASLNGTLQIALASGFNPAIGTTYKFLSFKPGELTGTFSSIENDYFNHGTEQWILDYDNVDGYLELIAQSPSGGTTPEPGSLALFGSGVLGIACLLRRKLLR